MDRAASLTTHTPEPHNDNDMSKPETLASSIESDPNVLEIPRKEDSLTDFCSKLVAIADMVTEGHSVAVVTGYAAATNQEQRAVQAAVSQMPPREAAAWASFQQGSLILPDMNWKANIDSTPLSPKPLKLARRRAEALNRLYKTDQAQPGHSVWFTQHYPEHYSEYLYLVKAMARIIGAERNLIGGGVWTATQLADVQSINKILAVTADIVNGHASKRQLAIIAPAQGVLVARRANLRNLLTGGKRKRGTSPIL